MRGFLAPVPRSSTRRPLQGGGFTLIELIAIMVIVSVLAAAAIPTLDSIDDTRGAMAGRQALRDLTYARERAVATGRTTWVVFDLAADTWSILVEDPSNPGRTNATALSDLATGRAFVQTLDSGRFAGIEITTAAFDGDVEIGFDWLGRPFNAAETVLAAQGSVTLTGGSSVTVAIETGHAAYVAP